jgi:hypothetical protein
MVQVQFIEDPNEDPNAGLHHSSRKKKFDYTQTLPPFDIPHPQGDRLRLGCRSEHTARGVKFGLL